MGVVEVHMQGIKPVMVSATISQDLLELKSLVVDADSGFVQHYEVCIRREYTERHTSI
jgi:hypothetical protein